MFNSIGMCHPLCQPCDCCEMETQSAALTAEPGKNYFVEMVLLREGKLQAFLEREKVTVSAGEALIICPGVKHRISALGDSLLRMKVIRMDPDRLPGHLPYAPRLKAIFRQAWKSRLPMVIPARDADKLDLPKKCDLCVKEGETRRFGYDLGMASRLSLICLDLVRYWLSKGLKIIDEEQPEDPIYSLSGYIQSHLRDSLRVEELAARCNLSYPWFARKFREIYGVSCKDYIEQLRVAQVEHFLLFTDMDLTRISEETGYADCSHMIKNFKRVMDITPGQYRLRKRQEAAGKAAAPA